MRSLTAAEIKASTLGAAKMEDRKRAVYDDTMSSAPALKRQATSVNGVQSHPDAEMYWHEDIERYQKDAILRQMREYKREKNHLEAEMAKMAKRAENHDEHLRLIDSWFMQLLDDLALSANASALPSKSSSVTLQTSILTANNEIFNEHLKQRSKDIQDATSKLFANFPGPPSDALALQERLSALLAAEKVHSASLQRLESEKEQLSDRLEAASYRYMVAEKKFDRARSAQVAKLEAQAISTSRPDAPATNSPTVKKEEEKTGSAVDERANEEAELAKKEAQAVAEKRKQQVEALEKDNKRLANEASALRIKMTASVEEDYAGSELFKTIKSQYEDVVNRVNDLEALNIQLRQEAKQLHAERTAYREENDNEGRAASIEMESQLARSEADLARIRHARDELVADVGLRKARQEQSKASSTQMQELMSARELRIESLEVELERSKASLNQTSDKVADGEDGEMDISVAKSKLAAVVKDKGLLENELRSMEAAFKKASAAASRRSAEMAEVDER